jgi:hypothetical protein
MEALDVEYTLPVVRRSYGENGFNIVCAGSQLGEKVLCY